MDAPFFIIEPKVKKVPIIISVPHCGTDFPDEIKGDYKESMAKHIWLSMVICLMVY